MMREEHWHMAEDGGKGLVGGEYELRSPESRFPESYDRDVAETVVEFEIDGGKSCQNTS